MQELLKEPKENWWMKLIIFILIIFIGFCIWLFYPTSDKTVNEEDADIEEAVEEDTEEKDPPQVELDENMKLVQIPPESWTQEIGLECDDIVLEINKIRASHEYATARLNLNFPPRSILVKRIFSEPRELEAKVLREEFSRLRLTYYPGDKIPPEITRIRRHKAHKLQAGDRILKINRVKSSSAMKHLLKFTSAKSLTFKVRREYELIDLFP